MGYLIWIGVGLLFGMAIFAILACRSAGYNYGNDNKAYAAGFFSNGTARMALSAFFGFGGGGSIAAIAFSVNSANPIWFGAIFGAFCIVFPYFYYKCFRWQFYEDGSGKKGLSAKSQFINF